MHLHPFFILFNLKIKEMNISIKFQAIDNKTDKVITEAHSQFELSENMEFIFQDHTDWRMITVYGCRGCESDDAYERSDYYGISTGHWCDHCYNSIKYPYKKDAYDPYNEMGTRPDPEDTFWENMATYNERFSGDNYQM